jgi:hypothetical protein
MVLVVKTTLAILPVLAISAITLGLLASIEVGYRFGTRRWTRSPTLPREVSSTVQASVFGLMGLLIAFIFYGAGARFDNRRTLVAEEANAVGTAYLRLDLLPPESQPRLREDFRAYLGARLDVNRDIPDMKAVDADLKRSSMLQQRIWKEAVEALKESGPSTQTLVLSALNQMIDIMTTRTVGFIAHLPIVVFALLAFTALTSSFLIGYSMSTFGNRDWIPVIIFTLVVGSAMYVIVDYEYPRAGVVRVDAVDYVLIQTLEKMQ